MADFTKFRTAINGFHRSDVVNYLEALCREHEAALAEANQRAEKLEKQLAEANEELERQQGVSNILQMQLTDTETALHETEKALEEALTMAAAPTEEPEEKAPDYEELELEAYRRAEAMERGASERAARVQQRLSTLVERVSARYEEAGQEVQALTEDIRTNVKRLADTLSDLDAIFQETGDGFAELDQEP